MKQSEYIEGPEAFANFERFATAILQAPKPKGKGKEKKKAKADTPQKNEIVEND
jgi:hypothetical protein